MGNGDIFKTMKILLVLVLLLVLSTLVIAQTDLDRDNIIDEKDACLNTAIGDKLPNPNKFPEYIGCSCSQIQEMTTGKAVCMDFYCVAGRPLEAKQRDFSKVLTSCEADYCQGSTLFDFPESNYARCVSGFPQINECIPIITDNAQACINGSVGQKKIVTSKNTSIDNESLQKPNIQIPDYVKKSFDLLLEDDVLKEYLSDPNREEFQEKIVKTLNNIDIKKEFTSQQITIDGKKISVPVVEISLMPNKDVVLKDVVVFEHIVTANLNYENFIFDVAPQKVFDSVLIWQLDELSQTGTKIRYKINTRNDFQSEVLVVGTVKSSPQILSWWPILLIPLFAYLAYWYMINKKE